VRYQDAVDSNDGEERDRLELFRSDLTAYVNAYDFLSQVLDYEDTSVEKFAIFARALARVIREDTRRSPIDLIGVELIGFGIRKKATEDLGLTGGGELDPLTHAGTAAPVDPVLASLMEAVSQLNQLFDDNTFTDADALGIFTHVKGKIAEDARLVTQRDANSEPQFLASPDLKPAVVNALITAATNHRGMTDELLDDDAKLRRFVEIIGRALYRGRGSAA
jgi:type I restriction enzyme R subunit